jgi:hypothetical protein
MRRLVTLTLHKSPEGSKEKGIAMTTGFNIMRLCVNYTNSGLLFAYGWPWQRAVRCRRQALFLHFLFAPLTFFATVVFIIKQFISIKMLSVIPAAPPGLLLLAGNLSSRTIPATQTSGTGKLE